jgi:putative flavoprotein involved in K+ transport
VGDELPRAVRSGRVELVGGAIGVQGDTVEFDCGEAGRFDAIVLATGFRPAIDWLDPTSVRLSDRGRPMVDRYSRSVVHHRLSCVGFDYPNTEGWLQALGRVSKRAARGIEESLRAP